MFIKKLVFVILPLLATGYSYAQSTFPTDGSNVGIGTPAPGSLLTIKKNGTGVSVGPGGNPYFGTIAFNRETTTGGIFDPSGNAFQINNGGPDKNLHIQVYNGQGGTIASDALVISGINGNIGVNTSNPSAKLEVSGAGVTPLKITGSNGYMLIDNVSSGQNYYQANDFHQFQGQSGNPILTMLGTGKVGIGTTTPDQMLSVKGTIHSQAVQVDMNGWSDFVFKPSYNLASLSTIKNYLAQNHHLPDMPSEKEVTQNGINVGDMLKLQTQKIEELTLYLIEKDQQLTDQKKEIEQFKQKQAARIAALEKALSKLTKDKD